MKKQVCKLIKAHVREAMNLDGRAAVTAEKALRGIYRRLPHGLRAGWKAALS